MFTSSSPLSAPRSSSSVFPVWFSSWRLFLPHLQHIPYSCLGTPRSSLGKPYCLLPMILSILSQLCYLTSLQPGLSSVPSNIVGNLFLDIFPTSYCYLNIVITPLFAAWIHSPICSHYRITHRFEHPRYSFSAVICAVAAAPPTSRFLPIPLLHILALVRLKSSKHMSQS